MKADSAAMKKLDELLKESVVKRNTQARTVFPKHREFFAHYTIDNFRPSFNKRKNEYYAEIDASKAGLDTTCTVDVAEPALNKRSLDAATIASIITGTAIKESEGQGSGCELISDVGSFKPVFVITTWKDPDMREDRISVVLVLPSGSTEFDISIEDGGEYLVFEVKWPKVLYEEGMLHKKWLMGSNPMAECHPKIMAFRDAIEKLQEKNDDQLLKSVARIPLPSPVEKAILGVECMQFSECPGAKVVYTDLRPVSAAEKKKKFKSTSLMFTTF